MGQVFLLHGMGRTRRSMALLGRRLEQAGYRTHSFGYAVWREDLGTIRDRFTDFVKVNGEPDTPYAVVAHSLGNVIARMARPALPSGWVGHVMIAPPNNSPRIARWLRDNRLFRSAARDAGQKLSDPDFFAALPPPVEPALIIAGTRGPRLPWLPLGLEANDTIVRVSETYLPGIPHLEVHGVHTFLMYRRDVYEAIRRFLEEALPIPA